MHFVTLVAEHWPQAPEGWQAGVAAGHWLSFAQGWQTCVVVLHTGVVPPQFALDVQGTHVAVAVSHAGVAPEHFVALVAEQVPHEPFGWQAGVAPGHWPSFEHAWQVCVVVLQTGVVPPHCAFDVQGTQVPVVA